MTSLKMNALLGFTALASLVTPLTASAAEISRAEADRIQSNIRSIIPAISGGAAGVTVDPDGDHYRLKMDIAALFRALEPFDLHFSAPGPYELSLAPLPNGDFRFYDAVMQPMMLKAKDQTSTVRFEGVTYEGVADPTLSLTRQATLTIPRTIKEAVAPKLVSSGEETGSRFDIAATETAPGLVDMKVVHTVKQMINHYAFGDDPKGAPEFTLDVATGPYQATVTGTGVRWDALRALVHWAAPKQTRAEFVADGATGKALLKAALPTGDSLGYEASVADLSVSANHYGTATITKIEATMGMGAAAKVEASGTAASASPLTYGARATGIAVASPLMPDWAKGLVPHTMDGSVGARGIDLPKLLAAAIDKADLAAPEPLTEHDWETLLAASGTETVYPKLSATSDLYDIKISGEIAVKAPHPTGTLMVRAKGLDKVLAALQAAKGAGGSGQAMVGLYAAKALSKPQAGEDVWGIEFTEDGRMLVNGQEFGGKKK